MVRGAPADFFFSPDYLVDLGGSPIDIHRSERILDFLLAERLLEASQVHNPVTASLWDLRIAHSAAYLDALRDPESLTSIVGVDVWPALHERALQAQRAATGGTLAAARAALQNERVAVNLGGGFHHAGIHSGKGFCIFNDVAVAIRRIRQEGFEKPILVIDLDLHDGNGTREIFAEDESVFTFSIHNRDWDEAAALASLSIALGDDVEDARYLEEIESTLPRLIRDVSPGLVFYLAGTDPAHDDRLGNWSIGAQGMLDRDRFVIEQTRSRHGLPLVVLLAGGYGGDTWRYSARTFYWLLSGGSVIEPPTTEEVTLSRYRHLAHRLGGALDKPEPASDDWGLTEAELFGSLGVAGLEELFLGRLSQHEMELILEWTGILAHLRQMGFDYPTLSFDCGEVSGDTLRIFSDRGRKELLIELRVRYDRHSIPSMELLSLEWLLLQNPRSDFSSRRPLPGQTYPGLGLLGEMASLLILICDRLRMDGLIFVPSHLHLAVKGKKYLRFVSPDDEAWFRAVYAAVADLPLAEASNAVARSRVVDASSGEPAEWHPMSMVMPISDRLHDLVEGEAYETAVEEAGRNLRFELASSDDPAR
jgi:acetoin utilization deacetylase AcuC-like enzyme